MSSDWSDTMVWFGQILLYLSFTILYIYDHWTGLRSGTRRHNKMTDEAAECHWSTKYSSDIGSRLSIHHLSCHWVSRKLFYTQILSHKTKNNLQLADSGNRARLENVIESKGRVHLLSLIPVIILPRAKCLKVIFFSPKVHFLGHILGFKKIIVILVGRL